MATFDGVECPTDCLVCDGLFPEDEPKAIDQGDNGNCDACGTEDGQRRPHTTTILISAKPVLVVSYLCSGCLDLALTGSFPEGHWARTAL